jgi:uncharacterized protein involved in outer membrane biogenesis
MADWHASPRVARWLKWTGIVLVSVLALVAIALALMDWNRLRGPIARYASQRSGYDVRIDGDLRVHPWSLTPSASVQGVRIVNPVWAGVARGRRSRLLAFDDATIEVKLLPLLIGRVIVERLTITRPVVDLYMDERGRANWRVARPSASTSRPMRPPDLPLVRRFVIDDGKVAVDDLKHRLRVHGTLSAAERASDRTTKPFRLAAEGTLNAEPFRMTLEGGPLINLDPGEPYTFESHVVAGATQVAARGRLPQPFDLSKVHVQADMTGRDLADLYFLSGVALPNSRPYRLAAEIVVNGTRIDLPRLEGRVGGSDLGGRGSADIGGERPRLRAALASRELDLGDLAAPLGVGLDTRGTIEPGKDAAVSDVPRANGRTPRDPNRRLLPDLELQVERVRAIDATVTYRAASVKARRVPFRDVTLVATLDGGVLTLDPVAFRLQPGRLAGRVRIDARDDVPTTTLDLRITGVELGKVQFLKTRGDADAAKDGTPRHAEGDRDKAGNGDGIEPPIEGLLHGRVRLEGRGASVRRFAAHADGGITFVVPKGEVNQALAELTGIDVARGLGLLLANRDEQTDIRCAVADFAVKDGDVESRTVVLDTDVVRITGRGKVDLGRERLDLALQGKPKKVSLVRLRTPIRIRGTFAQPALGVDAGKLAKQGGIAAALGVLLTPLASVLAFVDPGLAKDANCAALLDDAKDRGAPVRTRTAAQETASAAGGG